MVLVRRKDKRRGNKEEEIAVASDSSIVANKGVKSLSSARTGRFAADMRVQIGGYGRADKTWGVDHPWHKTREDILQDLSSRDRLEEGFLAKQDKKPEGHGLSRAALKKKKAKMKKGGLTESTAGSEFGSEAVSTNAAEEEKPQKEATAPTKKGKGKAKAAVAKQDEEAEEEKLETKADVPATNDEAQSSKDKKRKRVNRNKKKKAKNANGADSSDESELDESVEVVAKAKKKKVAAMDAKPTEVVAATAVLDRKQKLEDAAKREVVAKQYESALGQEFTTASGLIIRDLKIGDGRVPAIGEQLTVRYRGRIDDKNGIVFGKGMLSTVYGTGSVIAGWEEGMATMRAGGIRHLVVPPELGYGAISKGPKLPANSTLFFEVELVRIGKHKRDKIEKDDVPLPSSFQRKRIKSTPNSKDSKGKGGDKEKSKRRRRKFSI